MTAYAKVLLCRRPVLKLGSVGHTIEDDIVGSLAEEREGAVSRISHDHGHALAGAVELDDHQYLEQHLLAVDQNRTGLTVDRLRTNGDSRRFTTLNKLPLLICINQLWITLYEFLLSFLFGLYIFDYIYLDSDKF